MTTADGVSTTYLLRRNVALNRDVAAICCGERRSTWAQLADRVARLAGALMSLGVATGDRIAVLMLNQDRYVEIYLGSAWAGAVIVPLNTRWSVAEIEFALGDSRPVVLFLDAAFAALHARLAEQFPALKIVYAGDRPLSPLSPAVPIYDELVAASAPLPDTCVNETEPAGIFYTSGTTGRAKGVVLSHRNLMSNARNVALELGKCEAAVLLHTVPMFHLAGVGMMYAHFLLGSFHVVLPAFKPADVAQAIEQFGITDILLVPTMIQMFIDQDGLDGFDLSSLRRIIYGASPISETVLERAIARLPGAQFLQAYGMTELSPGATFLPWKDHVGEGRRKGRLRSCGRAMAMVDIRVIDSNCRPVPARVVGEIIARGDNVMMGYWERPEETQKAVVDGWMHTGDSGYLDEDGYLYVVDRIKDMIISGGENVYSIEVENCIAQHPAVAQCAVIGIPSEQWGEAVHAVVTRRPGVEVTPQDIIDFCRARIAHYKCPRSVHVQDEMLPLSGAGKILKQKLRAPFWENKSRMVN